MTDSEVLIPYSNLHGYFFPVLQIFGMGIGLTAILALLIPIAAKTHIALFYATRILQGIVGVRLQDQERLTVESLKI